MHPDNLNTFFQQFSTMMAPLCFSDCRYIAQTGRGTVGDPSDSAGPVMSETDLVRQPNRSIRTLQLRMPAFFIGNAHERRPDSFFTKSSIFATGSRRRKRPRNPLGSVRSADTPRDSDGLCDS